MWCADRARAPSANYSLSMLRPRTRSAAASARLTLTSLPAEIHIDILRWCAAADLRRAACVCSEWKQAVLNTAEARLRSVRPEYPPGSDASPCWLRSLAAVELLTTRIGPLPTSRNWRSEYVPLQVAAAKLRLGERWADEMAADFEPDGPLSFTNQILHEPQRQQLVEAGWSGDDADLLTHLAGEEENVVLMQSFVLRSSVFAASMHSALRAYTDAARRNAHCDEVPSPKYYFLRGEGGLVSIDPAWELLDSLHVGDELFVAGGAWARAPLPWFFPDESGMCKEVLCSTDPNWADLDATYYQYEPMDSDIVCFLSGPPDMTGYHALIQDSIGDETDPNADQDGWSAPMLSTFKLVSIREAGKWHLDTGRNQRLFVRRRLFTVSVSYG